MQYLLYILVVPFLYLNYKIIISDLKNKIIPNKYLGYLLGIIPILYIYIFLSFSDLNYYLFIGQVFLTFIISFILYYFGIWAAGDAKYLLVLSLFIPYIGIVPFIGNIALLTIVYLIFYFIWFYFGKCLFYKGYAKTLSKQIKTDLIEKWAIYKKNKNYNTYFIILRWILIFLLIFVSFRLSRIYLFNNFFENGNNFKLIQNFIEEWNIYLIFIGISIFIGMLYLIKLLIKKIKDTLSTKLKLNLELVGNILLLILFLILISFIINEYLIDSEKINNLLFLIFTLYLAIRIFFKILIYSYKITFGIAEIDYINIKNLKNGDIIDKPYLVKMFGDQIGLGHSLNKNEKTTMILSPSPSQYFLNINNPIDIETCKTIKKCYTITNKWHKNNKTENYSINKLIRILKTFSFAPYLLIGFLITYTLQNKLFEYIITFTIETIKKLAYS